MEALDPFEAVKEVVGQHGHVLCQRAEVWGGESVVRLAVLAATALLGERLVCEVDLTGLNLKGVGEVEEEVALVGEAAGHRVPTGFCGRIRSQGSLGKQKLGFLVILLHHLQHRNFWGYAVHAV